MQPESKTNENTRKLTVKEDKCPQNHHCPSVRKCPAKALSQKELNAPSVDHEKCTKCGKCVKLCPKGAFVFE